MKYEPSEIYEISRDDYVGFFGQIKKECIDTEIESHDNGFKMYVFNKTHTKHFATYININDQENYYIFDMPDVEERCPPKRVRKIQLNTREEVEAFFNIIAKLQKERDPHD